MNMNMNMTKNNNIGIIIEDEPYNYLNETLYGEFSKALTRFEEETSNV